MSAETPRVVRVSRRFEAPAERVFDAWLDPAHAGKWLFATPTGEMVHVAIDARVGGSFLFVDRRDGVDVEHVGEYIVIDRPRRLVFDFLVPKYSQITTRVTIEIVPLGESCELTLLHEGVLADYVARTEAGWSGLLAALASRLV